MSDWLNLNSLRSYPLDYSANPVADTGFVLPDCLLVDAMITAQADIFNPVLSCVHFSGSIVTAVFYDTVSGTDAFMAQASLTNDYSVSSVTSLGPVPVSGKIGFGEVSSLNPYIKTGIHRFDKTTALYPHCVMNCGAPLVTSFSTNLAKLVGNVGLITQGSMKASVSQIVVDGVTHNNIVFYLSDPGTYIGPCQPATTFCDCLYQPILQINSVKPDTNGNIAIVPDPILGVGLIITTAPGKIILSFAKSSKAACPPQNLPNADGTLPKV